MTAVVTMLICPCCKQERDAITDTPLLGFEKQMTEQQCRPWFWKDRTIIDIASLSDPADYLRTHEYLQWACNECLSQGRAIEAHPCVQLFCDYNPYLAYFDVALRC